MEYAPGATDGIVVAGGKGPGVGITQLQSPTGIYFDSKSNSLVIANTGANNIVRWVIGAASWTLLAGDVTGIGGSSSTLLDNPLGVTFDSMGNILLIMSNNQYALVQHCIDTKEFVTIKLYNRYLLFHQNLIKPSNNHQLDLKLSSTIIRKIFGLNSISIKDAQITTHVDSSFYDIIIFADTSLVYTRKRTLSYDNDQDEDTKKFKILPYYVHDDLELLKNIGMSNEDIDLFVKKLNANDNIDLFNSNKYDQIIQQIIKYTDIPTRLKCRQVSHKWKNFVDSSTAWNHVKLSKLWRYVDRALNYFQNIDIRELVCYVLIN
ncbi:unnamed protein product [Rotaria sp. Silwood2]|nr:unnamed protein product [Rotaria sp. Silwood2]